MTLEEYYIAWDEIKQQLPEGLNFPQEREWLYNKRKELQEQLSEDNLKIVLERQRRWRDKMQPSVD